MALQQSRAPRWQPWGIAIALISGTVFSSQPQATADTCYIVTGSGRRVGLGRLCGDTPASSVRTPGRQNNGVVSARIKRRIASTPVIEVNLNGQRFDMIVDSGASSTLITREMADALNIQPSRTIQVGIADGSVVQMPLGQVKSVSVNGLTARNLEVAIAEKMDVGLLGHDFFGNYDLKIKRDVVEFYPRQSQ
jgi:aspartyl protease family protein